MAKINENLRQTCEYSRPFFSKGNEYLIVLHRRNRFSFYFKLNKKIDISIYDENFDFKDGGWLSISMFCLYQRRSIRLD